jgi:hypothetical protein
VAAPGRIKLLRASSNSTAILGNCRMKRSRHAGQRHSAASPRDWPVTPQYVQLHPPPTRIASSDGAWTAFVSSCVPAANPLVGQPMIRTADGASPALPFGRVAASAIDNLVISVTCLGAISPTVAATSRAGGSHENHHREAAHEPEGGEAG